MIFGLPTVHYAFDKISCLLFVQHFLVWIYQPQMEKQTHRLRFIVTCDLGINELEMAVRTHQEKNEPTSNWCSLHVI